LYHEKLQWNCKTASWPHRLSKGSTCIKDHRSGYAFRQSFCYIILYTFATVLSFRPRQSTVDPVRAEVSLSSWRSLCGALEPSLPSYRTAILGPFIPNSQTTVAKKSVTTLKDIILPPAWDGPGVGGRSPASTHIRSWTSARRDQINISFCPSVGRGTPVSRLLGIHEAKIRATYFCWGKVKNRIHSGGMFISAPCLCLVHWPKRRKGAKRRLRKILVSGKRLRERERERLEECVIFAKYSRATDNEMQRRAAACWQVPQYTYNPRGRKTLTTRLQSLLSTSYWESLGLTLKGSNARGIRVLNNEQHRRWFNQWIRVDRSPLPYRNCAKVTLIADDDPLVPIEMTTAASVARRRLQQNCNNQR